VIRITFASLVLALALPLAAAAQESHLMRYADVSASQIVFTFEDDLWLMPISGGAARRITNHPGIERYAKFSPDGQTLAFTAEYDGGRDVYVMSVHGGEPTRLTYHPTRDRVLGWTADGSHVLFRSAREFPSRAERSYLVSVDGGMPSALPVDRAGLASLSPDGGWLAFNRQTREDRTWKRYQGGKAQDIWLANLATSEFYRITDWAGTDNFPMWEGSRIYFTSDRHHGTLNLFAYDTQTGETAALTDYADYDVKYPSAGPGWIVFQYAESLHLLELATGAVSQVPVTVPTDGVHMRASYEGVGEHVRSFRLSPTGKRLLLETRGEIVDVPVGDEGQARVVLESSASREKQAVWSPDGNWIAFLSDRSGEEEVYLAPAEGDGGFRQITTEGLGYRMHMVWSPDSRYLLFADKFMRLNLLDVLTQERAVVDQGQFDDAWERWGIQDYVWSPDSRWVAYSKMEPNMNESVFLFSLDSGQAVRVTADTTQDWSPSFDPEGRYLYFLSNRTFDPVMGLVDQNHVYLDITRAYAVVLKAGEPSPFAPENPTDPGITEEDQGKKKDKKKADKPATVIDLAGLDRRVVAVPGVKAGRYYRLEATADGFLYLSMPEDVFLKYTTVTDTTKSGYDLYGYDLEDEEATKLASGIGNYHLSADREHTVYRDGKSFHVVETGAEVDSPDAVDLSSVRIRVDRRDEFQQIFDEAWRVQRDWMYDGNMHAVDWGATWDKYKRFVPYCGNRGDLNYLIGEMIGELNIGHAYVWGGDHPEGGEWVSTGLLGATFDTPAESAHHRIAHIYAGTPGDPGEFSPLTQLGCDIRDGDYLIAIDGQQVTSGDNVYAFLQDKVGRQVTVSTNRGPTAEGATECVVEPLKSEYSLQYREFVEMRRAHVEAQSNGEIGYIHIPNMGSAGLAEFAKGWFPQVHKRGLVIDVRYNGGGFVADMIIDRIERRVWSMTQPREGVAGRNPERTFSGPIVVLINADSGSNAEFFAEAMKRKGLATVMGTRTWGGSIGIEPHQDLVDGGLTTPPGFGLYGMDRTWLIEGWGVEPDIVVWNAPASILQGVDSQLDAALVNLNERLAAPMPVPPLYPDKSK